MNALRNACAAAVFMGLALTAPIAYADESSAETLFQEGLNAMKRNDFTVACEAFSKSNKADPSPGTQINLAICYEKQKKWASAWTWYRSAEGLAQQRQQAAREKSAEEAATRIKPSLHYVVIVVKDPPPDLLVKRDGAEVTVALGGKEVPLPIDPGEHSIEITAPGKKLWQKTISMPDTPATDRVDVTLEAAPIDPSSPAGTPGGSTTIIKTEGNDGSGQRTVGLIVGGAGILTGLAAVGVYILAVDQANQRDKLKEEARMNPAKANDLIISANTRNDAAKNDQLIAIILGAGSGVMLGLGAVLYFTAPKAAKTARLLPAPVITPTYTGLGWAASF